MQEYVCMAHVCAACDEDRELNDFNLTLYRGGIQAGIGLYWSGILTCKALLLRQIKASHGVERFEEGPADSFCIDRNTYFSDALTIGENLFGLQWKDSPHLLERQGEIYAKTEELLGEIGLEFAPDTYVEKLSLMEKRLLGFALARKRKVSLLILDCIGCYYSKKDYGILKKLILTMKEDGVAVLILDEQYNPLLEEADQIALLKNGTKVKTLYRGEITEENVRRYLLNRENVKQTIQNQKTAQNQKIFQLTDESGQTLFEFYKGSIIGIYDPFWEMDETMYEYCEKLLRVNHWKALSSLDGRRLLARQQVYVPENSGEELFHSFDLGYNIALVGAEKIASKLGIVRENMKDFLRKEFLRKFEISEDTYLVSELSQVQRKLLSIYRFMLLQPKILLLENPMLKFVAEDKEIIKEYILNIAAEGTCVIISSKELANMMELCEFVLMTENKEIVKLAKEKTSV